jgi:RNase P/RNase MRP subunit POP5
MAMRYQNISIERLKSKAKLLKRYISHPVMEAPDLSLTDIQRIIAQC